jgi:hypothetical protein
MVTNDGGTPGGEPSKSDVSLGALYNPIPGQAPPVTPPATLPVVDPATPPVVDPPTTTQPIVVDPPAVPAQETFEDIIKLFNSDTISAEDKLDKDLLLSSFKATKLDDKGNLLNDANEVVLNATKVKAFLDNNTLPLDDKGNVINDKGEIIKTKEQVLKENSVVDYVRNAIETNTGLTLPADLELPDDETGIVTIVTELLKSQRQTLIPNFLDANPELKGFAEHLMLGGTAENYSSSNIDYKAIKLKDLDDTSKLGLVRKSFEIQGSPNSEMLLDLIKTGGDDKINQATADAIKFLDAKQSENNSLRSQQVAQAQKVEEQRAEIYWGKVQDIVTKSGKVGNIVIPVVDREKFFDYLSHPIDEEYNTADYINSTKDSVEFNLLVSYLRYKGGDVGKLAALVAQQQHVENLRSRFDTLRGLTNGNGVPQTSNTKANSKGTNLSLENLMG